MFNFSDDEYGSQNDLQRFEDPSSSIDSQDYSIIQFIRMNRQKII
jgi:hypothetical protein